MAKRNDGTRTRTGVAKGTDNTTRKQAEEALLKAGALQSAIFNSANFSSIATDAKGVIQIFNVGAERMLGYTAAEVMNKITPADISDPQELIARAKALSVELGTPITPGFEALVFKASRGIEDIYELTYIRKDGSRFPAVVSVTALRDAQDAIIGYLLIGTDNTARKQAEEALLKAGALQSAIFNSANFSSIATDAKGVIQIFNVGAERMLGYTAAEVMNKITPADISDPQEADRARQGAERRARNPDHAGLRGAGVQGLARDRGHLRADLHPQGRQPVPGGGVGHGAARRAGRHHRLSADRHRQHRAQAGGRGAAQGGALQSAIFNSANFSSIATDAKGVIQIFNVGAERMLGYTAAEVMNKITPADISDPQEADRARQGAERRARNPDHAGLRGAGVQGLARDRGHLRADLHPQGRQPVPGGGVGHGAARRAGRHHRLSADRHRQHRAQAGRSRAEEARSAPARPAVLHALADRIQHRRADDHRPVRHHHRRQQADGGAHRLHARRADRRAVQELLHRSGAGRGGDQAAC